MDQRRVAAAVVDIDELEVETGDGVQGGDEAAMGLADDGFLVEAGDDDGQECAGHTCRGGALCHWRLFTTEPLGGADGIRTRDLRRGQADILTS